MERSNPALVDERAVYQLICQLSEKMKSCAEGEDWDHIVFLDEKRRVLIEHLRKSVKKERVEGVNNPWKIDLIQRILSADKETTALVKARLLLLRNGFKTERRLLATYSTV